MEFPLFTPGGGMLRTILQNGIASNYTKKGVTPSYNPVWGYL